MCIRDSLIELVDARRVPSTPMMTVHVDKKLRADRDAVQNIALQVEVTTVPDVASIGTVVEDLTVVITPNAARMGERGIKREELVNALTENLDLRLFELARGAGAARRARSRSTSRRAPPAPRSRRRRSSSRRCRSRSS